MYYHRRGRALGSPPAQGSPPKMSMGFTFDNTVGAYLIGLMAAFALYGIACCQAYQYFQTYMRDPSIVKGTVISLLTLGTFHTVLHAHIAYWMVKNYLNPIALLQSPWSSAASIAVTSVIVAITHSFYAVQIYQFCKKLWLVGIILVLALVQLGFSLASTTIAVQFNSLLAFMVKKFVIIVPVCTAGAGDIICAVTLCYYLYKNRSGFHRTDSVIRKIMIYTISTNTATSFVAITVLITLLAEPPNFIFSAIFEVSAILYLVSVLARLNSRRPLKASPVIDVIDGEIVSREAERDFMSTFRAANGEFSTTAAERCGTMVQDKEQDSEAEPTTSEPPPPSWTDPSTFVEN
ncbi:hypothetical protein L218DRAFT_492646 [Marasmius fiardii PR-910]|nr:hypothetical protein L218DRAFT_492646 [Marasmius fiardii PR-910]